MARDVDAAARVGVLEPGAADVGILLEHDDVDADLLEAVSGDEPGHARADDADAELAVGSEGGGGPVRRAEIRALEAELLDEERPVIDERLGADHEREELVELVVGGRRNSRGAAVEPVAQRALGLVEGLLDELWRDALLGFEGQVHRGTELVAEDRSVARDVGDAGKEGGDLRRLDRSAQRGRLDLRGHRAERSPCP